MRMAIFITIVCFMLSPAVYSAQNVEIWTYDTLPPLAYRDEQGMPTGVYIEIVKQAVARMPDYTVSFKVGPWSRVKKAAEQGKAFAILPPYFHAHDWLTSTEPKRPYIWPYSQPLFTQTDVVICNEKVLTTSRQKYPDDYRGLKFVMWRGDGRAGEAFFSMAKKSAIDIELVNSIGNTIPNLLTERADCTVVSKIPFAWYKKQLQASSRYKKYDKKGVILKEVAVISHNAGYLGYTDINADKNFPFKKDFVIKFDIEVYKMRTNGEIQSIVDRFVE